MTPIRIYPQQKPALPTRAQVEAMPEPARTKLLKHLDYSKKLEAELAPERTPLIQDLFKVGYIVDSIYDMVNSNQRYPEAISVLCKHLRLSHHPLNREAIARSLITPDARGVAGRTILEELMSERSAYSNGIQPSEAGEWENVSAAEQFARRKQQERYALALALSEVADPTLTEDLRALVDDPRFLDVRKELKSAFRKSKQPLKSSQNELR